MIQRKQTLFLLAVVVIAFLQFFIPFGTVSIPNATYPIDILIGFKTPAVNSSIFLPLSLIVLVIIISIIVIFLYKKRALQFKISNLLGLLNIFTTGLFFLLNFFDEVHKAVISYNFGAFLPIIGAIFAFLAAHFIKKDEMLVRSADRIR